MYFLISHGLDGGFGGENGDFIGEYFSQDAAADEAYRLAVEDYECYEGCHGIRSYVEICEEDGLNEDSDEAESAYIQEIDSWICYSAQEVYRDVDGIWRYTETNEEVEMSDISCDI